MRREVKEERIFLEVAGGLLSYMSINSVVHVSTLKVCNKQPKINLPITSCSKK